MRAFVSLVIIIVTVCCIPSKAQQQIPTDPKVRIGKLDNGLTYIIRHNERPKNQADFYIAQKVGSILEEDNQRGLAHFLEHMCFNGTTHFPGKKMIEYLESIGVKFGANLNAYTSVDETVYNISNAPVSRDGIVDSCLLILADWSCGLTLDPKEIDAERGVVHEEWRTRENAQLRMLEQVLPKLYQGSKYAYRMPIGLMEVVDNFKPKALRSYYEKWYRPDQQAIIVVGDIDVDKVEQKIKATFSDIKMPKNAAKREYVTVPDNKEPIVAIATDKEQPSTQFSIMFKYDPVPVELRNSVEYYAFNYALSLGMSIINERFEEMTKKPGCPWLGAGVQGSDFLLSQNKDAFIASAACKEDSVIPAMKALSTELERVRRFGFTQAELNRAKANYLQGVENLYNERDNHFNDSYSKEYVRYFTQQEPTAGIEMEYEIFKMLDKQIPLTAVNEMIKNITDDKENMIILLNGPDKEGVTLPKEDALLAAYTTAKQGDITALEDNTPTESFSELVKDMVPAADAPGKIVKEEKGEYGSTVMTLSNGARVVIKPTDFKADEISMSGFSAGGTSLYDVKDTIAYNMMDDVVSLGGVATFSNDDLSKLLAGHIAYASASTSSISENISGGCTVKDFETMLQLAYLRFTAPRKDMDAFNTFKQQMRTQLERAESMPEKAFSDTINVALFNHNPRATEVKASWIDKIDYDRCMELYKDRFSDASEFTFVLVGNVDLENARPLIARYLANLPATNRKETWRDNKVMLRTGYYENNFSRKLETKKATVLIVRSGKIEYNLRNKLLMSLLTQSLNTIYLDEVREKAGGTYGVQVSGYVSLKPRQEAVMQIYFDTDPAKRVDMTKIVKEYLDKVTVDGPAAETLQKYKEYLLKSYRENQRENGYWLGMLRDYYEDGMEFDSEYEKTLNSITSNDIRDFAKLLLSQGNDIEVSMSDNTK